MMFKERRSMQNRFFRLLVSLVAACLLIQVIVQSFAYSTRLMESARLQMTAQARQLLETLHYVDDKEPLLDQIATTGRARITVFSATGSRLWDSAALVGENSVTEAVVPLEIKQALESGEGWQVRQSDATNERNLYAAVSGTVDGEVVVIRLSLPVAFVAQGLFNSWLAALGLLLLLVLLAIAVALVFTKDLADELALITGAVKRLAAGDTNVRITASGEHELGTIALGINRLAESTARRYQEMTEAKAQFETVIQNTVSGIFLLDEQGRVSLANAQAGRVLGFNPEEDVPDHFSRMAADKAFQEALGGALSEKSATKQTVSIEYPSQRALELHVLPLPQKGQYVAVFYDISEAGRLAAARADLVANVSHELKTPLTSIHGFAETILDEELIADPKGQRFMEIIYKESQRLLLIVKDLLDLSYLELHPEGIGSEPCDLVKILREVVADNEQRAISKHIDLQLVLGVDRATVVGDAPRLIQAVDNLLVNAFTYTSDGGQVRVNLEYDSTGFVITVRDTGIGIAAHHLPRIFERFYRTDKARSRQQGGTGLGLSIVKHITELHGGRVSAESVEGLGTAFHLRLPDPDKEIDSLPTE